MKHKMENIRKNVDEQQLPGRKWLFLGAIFSLLFLLYGSLVPLNYTYMPLNEAWSSFLVVLSDGLHIHSRVDMGENFLLMIPVGFFSMGAVWPNAYRRWIFPLATSLWFFCLTCSFLIEFTQIFFQGRTPTFSDILMQAAGSFVGIITWYLWGHKLWIFYFQSFSHNKSANWPTKILYAYLFILIGYNIVPFDITVNPFSIYQKYKAGRIVLLPFGFSYNHMSEFIYSVSTDVLIWVPVGFFWCLVKAKKVTEACFWTLFAVITLEVTQIFISSRIFDVTDIILGSIGGIGGVLLALKISLAEGGTFKSKVQSGSEYRMTWVGLALFSVWLFFLALIFWFPFDVLIERKFIESQLNRFFQVPFYTYYYSGGLTAITAVLRKSIFFIPLGVFASIAYRPLRKFGVDSLLFLIAFLCFVGAGIVIELGQALMPNKIPDSTDLLFETIGGVCGFCMMNYFMKRSER